ncbi:hypothetical protein FF36_02734 [Frankia torreyi]|uniref:Uncharacterized protein n=1 Tax=Frankia torreyi TaxID=1856 RepID=A0A0D8BFX7_9ACTN|nr:hypothetical protein FF36_02734 [Frankia torreyi]KQM04189.1 hypothetical protein FF86_102944 [Frankia sp. CpI1-P]
MAPLPGTPPRLGGGVAATASGARGPLRWGRSRRSQRLRSTIARFQVTISRAPGTFRITFAQSGR